MSKLQLPAWFRPRRLFDVAERAEVKLVGRETVLERVPEPVRVNTAPEAPGAVNTAAGGALQPGTRSARQRPPDTRKGDRHKPGYMAAYMKARRAAKEPR